MLSRFPQSGFTSPVRERYCALRGNFWRRLLMHRATRRWVAAAFMAVTVSMGTCFAADQITHWTFAANQEPKVIALQPGDLFSREKGFGFESGAQLKPVDG